MATMDYCAEIIADISLLTKDYLSSAGGQDRFPSPYDDYDDQPGNDGEENEEPPSWPRRLAPLSFEYPPVPRVVGYEDTGAPIQVPLESDWLRNMVDEQEDNHAHGHSRVDQAYEEYRKAAADVLELQCLLSRVQEFQEAITEDIVCVVGKKAAKYINAAVAMAMESGKLPEGDIDGLDESDSEEGRKAHNQSGNENGDDDEQNGGDYHSQDGKKRVEENGLKYSQNNSRPRVESGSPHPPSHSLSAKGAGSHGKSALKRRREDDDEDDESNNDPTEHHRSPQRKRPRLSSSPGSSSNDSEGETFSGPVPWYYAYVAPESSDSDSSYSTSDASTSDSDDSDNDAVSDDYEFSSGGLSDYSDEEDETPSSPQMPPDASQGSGLPSGSTRPPGKPLKPSAPRAKKLRRDHFRIVHDEETGEFKLEDYTLSKEFIERRRADAEAQALLEAVRPDLLPYDEEADLRDLLEDDGLHYEFDNFEWKDLNL